MATTTKIGKNEIKEAIKSMNMVEIAELVKELEEEFGVSAQAAVAVAAPAASAAAPAAEQTEFSVILVNAGGNKIPVIKEIRTITGLGLKEAKDLVEAGGKTVKENVSKDEAEKIKAQLVKAGATAEIK